jgi:glycosyltransferase involved in cell wall biosynthesis
MKSTDTMKIAYIVGQGEGGLSHYTAELANAVAEDHQVTILKPETTDADEMFSDCVTIKEVFDSIDITLPKIYNRNVHPINCLRGVLSYTNLTELLTLDVDVVHDTTGLFPHVKFFLQRHDIDAQLPLVVTFHEVSNSRFAWSRPPVLIDQLLRRVIPDVSKDRIVVHTDKQRQALLQHGYETEDICVIPHGAYSVFGGPEDISVDTERNTLLFFGHVVPPKGTGTLVKAIPRVKEEIPDVTLVVAGDGQIPNDVQPIIENHPENFDINNYYIPNEKVKEFFARAEVVVMPYRNQHGTKGHSGALATAFSFGKPVIASTAGEFPSLVGETGAGTVVPPCRPDRLAKAIVRILSDESMKREMRRNSQQMADRLSWGNIAAEHVDVYRRLVQQPVLYE